LSGVEFIRALSDHLRAIPVVAISESLNELAGAYAAGAANALAKPFTADAMLSTLDRHRLQ
jgi:CheY-like chemotaxis protein